VQILFLPQETAMASPSKRISTSGPQGGLNPAFAGLQLDGLPAGPACVPPEPPGQTRAAAKPGRVVLRREKAQRGGKTVILVDGFGPQHTEAAIEMLAKRLRASCGCGGTVRSRVVEVQGDQASRVRSFLEDEGFQVAGEK
jgi:translation initiation factor 1